MRNISAFVARAAGTVHSMRRSIVSLSNTDTSGISILQLKNEPLNMLSLDLMSSMTESIKEAESRGSCRGLILTSTCRLFSAGLDLDYLVKPEKDKLREYWSAYQELCFTLYGTRLATVAGMDGHTLGAGCAVALCCDSRVLMSSARIGLNEAEYGFRVPPWTADILSRTVGEHQAERACSLGTIFDADHASVIGLVDVVARYENFSVEVYKEAMKWSSIPGRSLNKQLFRSKFLSAWSTEESREKDFDAFFEMVSDDRKQAVLRAYMEHLGSSSSKPAADSFDDSDTFEDGEDIADEEEKTKSYGAKNTKRKKMHHASSYQYRPPQPGDRRPSSRSGSSKGGGRDNDRRGSKSFRSS